MNHLEQCLVLHRWVGIGVRERSKSCTARPQEVKRHTLPIMKKTGGMKIGVEDSKINNTPKVRKRLKTVNQRKGGDKTKSFRFHSIKYKGMSGNPSYI